MLTSYFKTILSLLCALAVMLQTIDAFYVTVDDDEQYERRTRPTSNSYPFANSVDRLLDAGFLQVGPVSGPRDFPSTVTISFTQNGTDHSLRLTRDDHASQASVYVTRERRLTKRHLQVGTPRVLPAQH